MRFVAAFITVALSSLSSTADASFTSSKLDIDSNGYIDPDEIVDGARVLKSSKSSSSSSSTSSKSSKSTKSTKKSKGSKSSSSSSEDTDVPRMGSRLAQPHKLKYERRTMCIAGVNMHGCADGAPNHIQEIIKGVRHVKHEGSFVAKSACDYSSKITKGSTPDLTQKGTKLNHSSRDANCKDGRLLQEIPDPNEQFVYDSIVVIENVKYKRFIHRIANAIEDDGDMEKVHHLMTAGLTPDTLVYLEDMDDKPHCLEAWNGNEMIHQTMITEFEGILEDDSRETADEIMRRFAGDDEDEDIVLVNRPIQEPRDAGAIDFNFEIPNGCNSDSKACLALDANTTLDLEELEFNLELDFNFNKGSASLSTDIVCEVLPDPSLKSAKGKAKGCIKPSIVGKKKLEVDLCLGGSFDYEPGDSSPAEQTYEVSLSGSISADVLGIDPTLMLDGSLTMKVESVNDQVYFIGYDGLVELEVNIKIVNAGAGLGIDYDTQSYKTYNDPNGWATKFFAQLTWGVDLGFFTDNGTYTHIFSCDPSANALCRGSGDPSPPTNYPGDKLTTNESLQYNTMMKSSNQEYSLILQTDGNLVIYGPGNKALWASGTDGDKSTEAIMQDDGNFVIYDQSGNSPWASGTEGEGGSYIVMQSDGNLVIYNNNGDAVWATGTCQR